MGRGAYRWLGDSLHPSCCVTSSSAILFTLSVRHRLDGKRPLEVASISWPSARLVARTASPARMTLKSHSQASMAVSPTQRSIGNPATTTASTPGARSVVSSRSVRRKALARRISVTGLRLDMSVCFLGFWHKTKSENAASLFTVHNVR